MEKSKSFQKLCAKHGVDPNLIPEITSFEDACKATGTYPHILPGVTGLSPRYEKRLVADYQLSVIADALREGVDVNYLDNSAKYWPVFLVKADKKRPSGFGLSFCDYVHWYSHSIVGVRLCFPNPDMAEYFGKQFLKLHIDHHLLT